MSNPSRLLIAPDVRTAEAALFAALERRLAAPEAPPAAHGRARIVVPSHSLRRELLGRLALRRPAWLGLEVLTARALALDLLARAGESPPRGAPLFAIELTRAARRHKALAGAFGEYVDGWAPLAAAARDLVDAGLRSEHLEPLAERIESEAAHLPRAPLGRARSLLGALGATLAALEARALAPDAELFVRAADVLRRGAPPALPPAYFLHGFSDATGVIADLIEALARTVELTALLVQPGDFEGLEGLGGPGAPSARETAWSFGARLRERLAAAIGPATPLAPTAGASRRCELVAASPELEARAVVAAARRALDDGVRPERIGLVARNPGPYRAALRRELARQGVPYSASEAFGPTDPVAHRSAALLRALETGADTPVDLLVDLVGPEDAAERGSLRLALRSLGLLRLAAAAARGAAGLDGYRAEGYPLPARAGMAAGEGTDDAEPELQPLVRRRLAVEPIEEFLQGLRRFASGIERWPAAASWGAHRTALATWLGAAGLGDTAAGRRLLDAAARLDAELPGDLALERDEAIELLRGADATESTLSTGGGGGVQLLTLVEARGRSFDRLFVLGLVRGSFPRLVAAEPVLPDRLRLRLRDLLPDLPVKGEGHEEERYLFAQLAGAAPLVVFSRSTHDDEGKPLPASALLESARRRGALAAFESPAPEPAPLLDRAAAAGLAGGAPALAELLPAALEEGRRRFGAPGSRAVAAAGRARLRVLLEYETDPAEASGRERIRTLGPYFGFLGRSTVGPEIAATTLEAQAACAWQAFLEKSLRLEPLPDPLAALPALERRWIGTAVHEVLGRLFGAAGDGERSLARALTAPGVPRHWPEPAAVRELARSAARATLRAAGHAGEGLERLLAEAALVHLEEARALDQSGPPATALGTELDGACELADDRGRSARITFRVDRLSREGATAVLDDFKIGGPGTRLAAAKPETRREKLLAAVRTGSRLQTALYLAGSGPGESEARYLFLAPDLEPDLRRYALRADAETAAARAAAAAALLGARRRGLHPPRLVDSRLEDEYEGCDRCAVAEACVRGDSGFRLRLERWHELQAAAPGRRDEHDEALWRLWRLPADDAEPPR